MIKMSNPLAQLTKAEWILWGISLAVVICSNIMTGQVDVLTIIATCLGVSALIFAAKGHVISPMMMIVFSILYGVISWRFRYWGEMITYLGMTLPMSIWSTVTWLKNPSENGTEVAIRTLTKKHVVSLAVFGIITTAVFYVMLRVFDTPNIVFSTLSVLTSFVAAALTMLRSSYYALWYALNDIILIVLWILASMENLVYIPLVANFAIFLINDMYGFVSWKKREGKKSVV